jgi:hypothetical protein
MSYVPLADFEKYTEAHDKPELLQSYLDAAENIVNAYLGYSPTLHAYDQNLDGTGTTGLQLQAKPVRDITGLEINGQSVPVTGFVVSGEFIYSAGTIFPEGKRNVKILYTAGWGDVVDDDENNGVHLPRIITMTVLRIAALLQSEGGANIGVTSKSFADSGTRTFVNTVNFDKYLVQISPYKLLTI